MSLPSTWLLRPVRRPAATVRLVCVPHAGAGPSTYRDWAADLPGAEVALAYLPGRERRFIEPAADRVEQVADPLAEAVLTDDPRPVALFGHSMGALVAYETARRMACAGRPPVALFLSGCRAAELPPRRITHDLPDDGFIAALHELGGTPAEVLAVRELLTELLPLLRTDFKLAQTYHWTPGAPLTCPIHAFHGADDPGVSAAETRAWARYTTGGFSFTSLPGDHFFIVGQRATVTGAIARDLAAVVGARVAGPS